MSANDGGHYDLRMADRVSVVGGTPTWRRGMSALFSDAGYTTVEYDTIADWNPGRGVQALIVAAENQDDLAALRILTEAHPHIPVVAVSSDLSVSRMADAVRAGAIVGVDADEATATFVSVIEAAVAGHALVQPSMLKSLASRVPTVPDAAAWVTTDEADWLRRLAQGATVADLADAIGYSERETFRMLREAYSRIGATNRTEAIIWATRNGLLDPVGD